jgi:PIN domain nuclease of toxin-antitoxin system
MSSGQKLKKAGKIVILGTDSGFFIGHHNQHARVLTIWQELLDGQHTLIVSTLSINELLVYFYKRGLNAQSQTWLDLLTQSTSIRLIPVTYEIAAESARYRLGLHLPTVDAIILTTFLNHACDLMITTDSHFQIVSQQNLIPVEFLS